MCNVEECAVVKTAINKTGELKALKRRDVLPLEVLRVI